jgi:hypothetical protein
MPVPEVSSSMGEQGCNGEAAGQVCAVQESLLEQRGQAYCRWQETPNFLRPGYVYVLGTMVNGRPYEFAKIGKATDPIRRLTDIETAYRTEPRLPFGVDGHLLIMECWYEDMDKVERYLHKRYAKQRLNGEWFRLNREDWDDITELTNVPWPICNSCLSFSGPELYRLDTTQDTYFPGLA